MFSFGSKVKQKLSATRFEFSFVVHNLAPWPEGSKAIAIGYQRGKRRRGATRSVYPSRQPGRLGAVVRINERFDMPVTLYKANNGSANSGGLGPFKKKCLILAVLETDGRTQATAALGRVVIDLSEYAAIEHTEMRTFMVSCNKSIHAAVGDPQLMITIRCRWKKLAKEGGGPAAAGQADETASMSTDTTGSRMTANLSSFLRFKFTGKGNGPMNEEQDLRGFESSGPSGGASAAGTGSGGANGRGSVAGDVSAGVSKVMDTIQESHDEPAEPVFASFNPTPAHSTPGGSRTMTPNTSIKQLTPASSLLADPRPASGTPSPRQAIESAGSTSLSAFAQGRRTAGDDKPYGAPSVGLGGGQSPLTARSASTSALNTIDADLLVALRFELLTVAALEAAVAGAGDSLDTLSFWWSNAVHMRAMLTGLSLAAAAAGVLAPTGGGVGLAVAAAVGGGGPSSGSEHWATAVLVPELRRLERAVFDDLLGRMWEKVLLPTALGTAVGRVGTAGSAAAAGATAARPAPAPVTKRAQQEAAIKKWFEALEAVSAALSRQVGAAGGAASTGGSTPTHGWAQAAAGPVGHCALLRQQVLLQCLKRVDLLLFAHLLGGAETPGVNDLLADYDPHGALAASSGPAGPAGSSPIPHLDDGSLPFARGVLTFGGGMSVKMTVTRLQQWAAGQPALGGNGSGSAAAAADAAAMASGADRGGAGGGAGGLPVPTGPLFPLLRAAADLLMMPKELLLDRAVRLDVGAALSMRTVLHILKRFQPDEFAPDSISPAILESLREESAMPQMNLRSAAADMHSGYAPPPDAAVLRSVEAGVEPGLEYEADSEDELEELAQVVSKSSATGAGAGSSSAEEW
ncbi:hypothetical protein GPECTOR_34g681 [Gonium pectorale]|uniref:C2 NT-type domain-containing protein n=1 Tax=Gonium pectorale TaxID=33097 RepID=A0A150GCE6_GONPE|nr:hypothetical protein GPECTOR_34g681 [Gonium pectorale]|eukprot:KXZ47522.1 hypothetical protein GPECTOR_34g681 [Gonium pectorale]